MTAAAILEQPLERRSATRMRCFKLARCYFNKGRSDLEVTLRNISSTGARITGSELICLPDEFDLHIHDGFGGFEVRRVRRIWSRGGAAGLRFLDAPGE